jgi:hypothetical protein
MAVSLGVVLAFTGCASISVKSGATTATKWMPSKIYVQDFTTDKGEFNVDRDGAELAEFKLDLQKMMTKAITIDLTKRVLTAVPWDNRHHPHAENAWLIRGQFVRVNQGSRLLRGAIGFGLGGTKLETYVWVYDLSDPSGQPFMSFTTTGGSNAEPGAVTSFATDPWTIAIQAAAGGAGNIAHGVTEDTKRTARQITAVLSNYMYKSGWIDEDHRITPKQYSN